MGWGWASGVACLTSCRPGIPGPVPSSCSSDKPILGLGPTPWTPHWTQASLCGKVQEP